MRLSGSLLVGLRNSIRTSSKNCQPLFFRQVIPALRAYSINASPTTKGTTTASNELATSSLSLDERKSAKDPNSRKTFLVDYYKYLNDTNEIVLFAHHNNITKNDNLKIRSDLKKHGAKLNIIRNNLYEVYLRSEHESDPADAIISKKNKNVKHPLAPLLVGPTAVITIPKCEPAIVQQVLKVLKTAQERLILIGAKIETSFFDIDDVNKFKDLPSRDQLQGQLAGLLSVLGGAGLVQTLEASTKHLYLTLDQHRKDIDPSEINENENEENK